MAWLPRARLVKQPMLLPPSEEKRHKSNYLGLAPGFVGLYQVNAVVPPGLSPGNQPVVIGRGISSKCVLLPLTPERHVWSHGRQPCYVPLSARTSSGTHFLMEKLRLQDEQKIDSSR